MSSGTFCPSVGLRSYADAGTQAVFGGRLVVARITEQLLHEFGYVVTGRSSDAMDVQLELA
jgi:hypothetical protein